MLYQNKNIKKNNNIINIINKNLTYKIKTNLVFRLSKKYSNSFQRNYVKRLCKFLVRQNILQVKINSLCIVYFCYNIKDLKKQQIKIKLLKQFIK